MRGFILICWNLIANCLLLLCDQTKVIQSGGILSKVRCCQRCYSAFCAPTVVVEHIDQNILTLFVFQRNKTELHLLWVLFPDCSAVPWSMANRWGIIDYLLVCVCLCARVYLYAVSLIHFPQWEIIAWASWFISWGPFCCIITRKLNGGSQVKSCGCATASGHCLVFTRKMKAGSCCFWCCVTKPRGLIIVLHMVTKLHWM